MTYSDVDRPTVTVITTEMAAYAIGYKAGIEAARERGDTYRARALALMRRGRDCSKAVNLGIRLVERYGHEADAASARAERLAGLLRRADPWLKPFRLEQEVHDLRAEIDAALAGSAGAGA